MSSFSTAQSISVHASGPFASFSHSLRFAFDHHDGEWSPAHLRLVQEPPKVWESWILIADAKSVSRERILILDTKPVSVCDEKAVSSEKPSQCLATSEVVKAGSPSSSCAILSVSLLERKVCRPWIPWGKSVRFREPFPA